MHAYPKRPRALFDRLSSRLFISLLVAVLIMTLPPTAGAADERLEEAQARRQEVQARLDQEVARLNAVQAEIAAIEAELARLQSLEQQQGQQAQVATGALAAQIRESYKRGSADPTLSLFSSASPQQAMEQAHLLGLLALRNREQFEAATAARISTVATAEQVSQTAAELQARRDELAEVHSEIAAALAEAQAQEDAVRAQIAAEEAARERARREREEREARERASRAAASAPTGGGGGSAGSPAPVTGNVACPVGQPRSYSDTYGAPRSGGRGHRGTDILAPYGTPIYAYESGVISRMSNSRLGGITLYLRGNSGNEYYYAHLQSYVSGLSPGQAVSVGQHIAANGDTGNARGTPHLHFEVRPGGGANVNPYPYVLRACG